MERIPARPSIRLVPWLRAWRAGTVSLDDVVEVMAAASLAEVDQHVVDADADVVLPCSLHDGLAPLSRVDADEIRLVLPVPGDVRGLPRKGGFTEQALGSAEAIRAGDFGLVARWEQHTSGSGDTWHTLTWWRHRLPGGLVEVETMSVGEADMALTEALREATRALDALDVAAWNGKAANQNGLRDVTARQLPVGFDTRARLLYERAVLLDHALELARQDAMGGAVSAFEAQARLEVLRPLAAACRAAVGAACHARIRL